MVGHAGDPCNDRTSGKGILPDRRACTLTIAGRDTFYRRRSYWRACGESRSKTKISLDLYLRRLPAVCGGQRGSPRCWPPFGSLQGFLFHD